MDIPEFLRLYQLRAPQIMWFLGAGASAASGVPTAYHLTWEFKRAIYCAEQRISIRTCADISDPALQSRIQQYFNSKGTNPPENSADEYAFYFEAAYPDEGDRRRALEVHISGARPSFGHHALAGLMKADKVRVLWTTNFDRAVEDAAAQAFGVTSTLTTATLDSASISMNALNEGRWPLFGKLHGDFQSRRLKNTSEELRRQDGLLRDSLIQAGQRFGLAVVGYSGRDDSVIEALSSAMDGVSPFPSGLFWFHRPEQQLLAGVKQLAAKAEAKEIQMHLIEMQTFDELMADVVNLIPDLPSEITATLDKRLERVSNAPIPNSGGNYPVLRLNAFPVLSMPATCRRVVCNIGGGKEVREAVTNGGSRIITARRNVGVLAFGSDADVRAVFDPFGITEFDIHNIHAGRLRYESAELGLLYDAMARALVREYPLIDHRNRRGHTMVCDTTRANDSRLAALRRAANQISGTVPKTTVSWAEGFRFKLEYRLDRMWLVLEPAIWLDKVGEDDAKQIAKDFVRERLAARYNRQWNSMLDAWSQLFVASAEPKELRAFGIADGIDAAFKIGAVTAYSARAGA